MAVLIAATKAVWLALLFIAGFIGATIVVIAGFTAITMIVEESIIQINDKKEERKYREDERKYRNQMQELSSVQTNDRG